MTTFKKGDVVQLKSGSPRMTVERRTLGEYYRCSWFENEGLQSAEFNADMLELVNLNTETGE